jgi:hypothetical protein
MCEILLPMSGKGIKEENPPNLGRCAYITDLSKCEILVDVGQTKHRLTKPSSTRTLIGLRSSKGPNFDQIIVKFYLFENLRNL